jgi:aldehyde:ferredoxin oxidoreductase
VYLHHLPFTNVPVADLWSLNAWMAARQQAHFQQFLIVAGQIADIDGREFSKSVLHGGHGCGSCSVSVKNLWSLNAWMAARQQAHFQQFLTLTEQEPQP